MDDLTGCTAIDSIVVSEDNNYPPLSAPTPAQLNCELTSTVLQGSSPVGGQILLKWATISANDTTYLGSGSTLSISVPGNYYLIGFDPINGCYNAIPVTVTQNILTPSVDAGPDDVITCDDVSIILNGSANGQGAVLSYTWTAPAFPNAVILQANTPTPTISSAGTYVLTVQNLSNFCLNADSMKVTQMSPLAGSLLAENPNCNGDKNGSILVQALADHPPYTFYLNGVNQGTNNQFELLGAGTYNISVVDGNGCIWDTTQVLNNPPGIHVSLGADLVITHWDSITVTAQTNIPAQAIETIFWRPQEWFHCQEPVCLEQTFLPELNGKIEVTLIDTNGCQASDVLNIRVDKSYDIYIPNVFMPDDNGKNDVFTIYGGRGIRQIRHFNVYDRWGEQVWSAQNFQPNDDHYGWDGTLKGTQMSPGVFVYVVEVELLNGETILLKGDVTLTK